MGRVILHSDMNACYASIELLHRPTIRHMPVAVGGDEESRHGIVLARNQHAKKYGVKTGNSLVEARRACPDLITVPPNYQMYLKFSQAAREIYADYSNHIEPFGIDEGWVDVSSIANDVLQGEMIAHEIRSRIKKELGITVSIGVSYNKIFAKLGSDMKKPDAVTAISREEYKQKVWPLPVSELLYVGPATTKKLRDRMVYTIGDLANTDLDRLRSWFGKVADMLWVFANGADQTPVSKSGEETVIKSVGNSTTFPRDLASETDVKMAFYVLGESVAARLRENGFKAGTVVIYIRDKSLWGFERQMKLEYCTNLACELVPAAMELFKRSYQWQQPIRSLGIRGTDLVPADSVSQLSLFRDEAQRNKREALERAVDGLRQRYSYYHVQRGIMLTDKSIAGLDAKNDNTIHPMGYVYTG